MKKLVKLSLASRSGGPIFCEDCENVAYWGVGDKKYCVDHIPDEYAEQLRTFHAEDMGQRFGA